MRSARLRAPDAALEGHDQHFADDLVLRASRSPERAPIKAEPGEDLTSCEAQREHCAMFIESQKYEGWERVRQRLDDVGESGSTLERPALHRLMKACVAGRSIAWWYGSSTA